MRRYKDSDVFDQIFKPILTRVMNFEFINTKSVFGDSTHPKAAKRYLLTIKNNKVFISQEFMVY